MRRLCITVALLFALTGCGEGGGPSLSEQLEKAGWEAEPTLEGAEQEIGNISPEKCKGVYKLLDRRERTDAVQGFSRDGNAYLLIRDWNGSGLVEKVRGATEGCRRMEMAYGPVTLTYDISTEKTGAGTRLRMTAKQDGELEMDMLVSASEKDGTQRLVRVMNRAGVGEVERAGADIALLG